MFIINTGAPRPSKEHWSAFTKEEHQCAITREEHRFFFGQEHIAAPGSWSIGAPTPYKKITGAPSPKRSIDTSAPAPKRSIVTDALSQKRSNGAPFQK